MTVRRSTYLYLAIIFTPLIATLISAVLNKGRYSARVFLKEHFWGLAIGRELNARFQNRFLQSPNVGNVHIGEEDWLFYIPRTDGNSLADFYGHGDAKTVDAWRTYLSQSRLKPFGLNAKYLFFAIPNKETIYADRTRFMFPAQRVLDRGNFAVVKSIIRETIPENSIDVSSVLRKGRNEADVYLRSDTHWSSWGSYLVAQELMRESGRLLEHSFAPVTRENRVVPEQPGDIAKMLGTLAKTLGYGVTGEVREVVLSAKGPLDVLEEGRDLSVYRNPQGKFLVWVVGDSFRERLIPFLPKFFATTVFISIRAESSELIMRNAYSKYGYPDLIIEERVERFLSQPPSYRGIFEMAQ